MRRLTVVLTFATAAALAGAARPADPPPDSVAALQDRMRAILDTAEPAVVAVVVSHNPKHGDPDPAAPGQLGEYTRQPAFGPPWVRPERDKLDLSDPKNVADYTFGTGLVLDEAAGLILTTYHLADGARKVFVRSAGGDGCYADIHAADARSDLAVLKLIPRGGGLPTGLKRAKLADVQLADEPGGRKASVFRGQFVAALGHPLAAGFADGQPSASWGILSNVRRRLPNALPEEQRTGFLTQYGSLLQTDARLALGSSGGALLNLDGEVIGLTTATAAVTGSEAGGGFAVPMTPIYRGIIEVLKTGREVEYGFLGVAPDGMSADRRRPGLVVNAVTPNSPAALAGLDRGDVIRAVNGRPIRELDDLFLLIGGALAGNTVTLTYTSDRRADPIDVKVRLAKFVHPHPVLASNRPAAVFGLRVEYSSVLVQQAGPGMRFGVPQHGVVVRELVPNSPAAAAFGALGQPASQYLITAVDGRPVRTPAEFYAAARGRDRVTLTVISVADQRAAARTVALP